MKIEPASHRDPMSAGGAAKAMRRIGSVSRNRAARRPGQVHGRRRGHEWNGCRGYLIIELMIYLGVLALIVGLAFAAYYRAWDNARALSRYADEVVRTLQAGERWRADIRAAVAAPEVFPEAEAGLVTIPHADKLVLYWVITNTVWRKEGTNQPKAVLRNVTRSQMRPDVRSRVSAWQWDVELLKRRKTATVRPLFTFKAVIQEPKP